MIASYDYSTGKIETYFHIIKDYEPCKGSGLPCWVGSERCSKCKYYAGSIGPCTFPLHWGFRLHDFYTMCKHPDKTDSEDTAEAWFYFNESLKYQAFCALDY